VLRGRTKKGYSARTFSSIVLHDIGPSDEEVKGYNEPEGVYTHWSAKHCRWGQPGDGKGTTEGVVLDRGQLKVFWGQGERWRGR